MIFFVQRIWLVALHFNENYNRDQAYTAEGKVRYTSDNGVSKV